MTALDLVTLQKQLVKLPKGSRTILEAAALLDQPFSIPLLIGLGFSADSLDPLFDSGIFREPFVTFTNTNTLAINLHSYHVTGLDANEFLDAQRRNAICCSGWPLETASQPVVGRC
jgi:hypothetical protein